MTVHVQPESVFRLDRNGCSFWPEYAQSSSCCDLSVNADRDIYNKGIPVQSCRFGDSCEEDSPELGCFKVKDPIIFSLNGWKHWNVILLNRRPDNRIVSLLPNSGQSNIRIPSEGAIDIPETGYWVVQRQDPPGIHQFAAIFHEKEWLEKEMDVSWFHKQLSLESDVDQQRSALSRLVDWLEAQDGTKPRPFEIVIKDMEVTL